MEPKRTHVEEVRRVAAEVAGPAADAVDREGKFPHETIEALKKIKMLSAFVPEELGGFGCGMIELAEMCELLAQHCSSAAMVFAMHQIQVACIARHGLGQPFFRAYLETLVRNQNVIASVTSEVGIGGEMRTSSRARSRPTRAGARPVRPREGRLDHLLRPARRRPAGHGAPRLRRAGERPGPRARPQGGLLAGEEGRLGRARHARHVQPSLQRD